MAEKCLHSIKDFFVSHFILTASGQGGCKKLGGDMAGTVKAISSRVYCMPYGIRVLGMNHTAFFKWQECVLKMNFSFKENNSLESKDKILFCYFILFLNTRYSAVCRTTRYYHTKSELNSTGLPKLNFLAEVKLILHKLCILK